MMPTRRIAIALIAVLVLVVGACGGDTLGENLAEEALENQLGGDVDLDVDEGSGEVNIETDEGSISFGGGDIPEELEAPVPDGGDVQSSIVMNDAVNLVVGYPLSEWDRVVEFYDEWTADQPQDFDRSTASFQSEEGEYRGVTWSATDSDLVILVNNCPIFDDGNEDGTCLTISQSG